MAAEATLRGASVLEVDPDLGSDIDPAEWEAVREACQGELLHVRRGPWRAVPEAPGLDGSFALVIIEGLLVREVYLTRHCMVEFLGHGDVLQPPVVTEPPQLGTGTRLTAVSGLVLLVLGQPFLSAAARWPTLLRTLHRRLEAQRESLAIQGLIAHLPTAEHRLLLTLWHLADRWGYVTPDGIVLPWALNHETLACLIGARRPTVTIAVRRLEASAGVYRRADGSWLLTPAAEQMIRAIALPSDGSYRVGERLMLYQRIGQATARSRALNAETRQIRSRHQALTTADG